jgi:hypothetical protein
MKKLFRIFTAIALLMCMAPHLFAADIVVKNVKIKKRSISNVTTNDNNKDNKFDIDEMKITTTTETALKTDNYTEFAFEFEIEVGDKSTAENISMDITVTDNNLKSTTETITVVAKNTGPGTHKCKCNKRLANPGGVTYTLTSAEITVTNPAKEQLAFEAKLNKKDKKDKGDCDEKYKLKEVTFKTDNNSGFYVMNFSFSFEKNDFPDEVTMLVQVTDCKGNKATVPVKLSYDPNTGIAVGYAGLMQQKGCEWTLTYGEIYGTNPCGDETTWGMDFGQVKTSGAGTRTTTTSVKNGRPELQ